MDKCLEKQNLPKLNQEKIENMNKRMTRAETAIKNLPTNKTLRPDGITQEFYQIFRKE